MPNARDLVFLCELCDFQGGSHQSLMYHGVIQHNVKVFACRYCDHVCKDKYKTVRHTRNQHHEEMQTQRMQDGKVFDYSPEIIITPPESDKLLCYFEQGIDGLLNCVFCDKSLNDKSEFSNHLCSQHNPVHFILNDIDPCVLRNRSSEESPFICKLCRSSCVDLRLLAEHIFISHPFNIFSDKINPNSCPIPIRKQQRLNRSNKHKCPFCLFSSFFSKNLKKHMAQHGADMKFKCSICNFSTDFEMILTKHKRYFHTEPQLSGQPDCVDCNISPKWVCPICKQKKYYNRKSLMNHWRTKHRDATSNETPINSLESLEGTPQTLGIHVNIPQYINNSQQHLSNNKLPPITKPQEGTKADEKHSKWYKCPQCQRNVRGWTQYVNHKRTHVTKVIGNKFKCDLCSFLTSSIKYLKQHQARHIRRSQVEFSRGDLKRSDTGLKSKSGFKCEFCPFFAKNISRIQMHLNCHRRIHSKYKCQLCSYGSDNQGFLKKHSKVHTQEYLSKFHASHEDRVEVGVERSWPSQEHVGSTHTDEGPMEGHAERLKERGGLLYCEKCPFVGDGVEVFINHTSLHFRRSEFKCLSCDYSVPSFSYLLAHSALHQPPIQHNNYQATNNQQQNRHHDNNNQLNNKTLVNQPQPINHQQQSNHPPSTSHHYNTSINNTPLHTTTKTQQTNTPINKELYSKMFESSEDFSLESFKSFYCPMCQFSSLQKNPFVEHMKAHENFNSRQFALINNNNNKDGGTEKHGLNKMAEKIWVRQQSFQNQILNGSGEFVPMEGDNQPTNHNSSQPGYQTIYNSQNQLIYQPANHPTRLPP